MDELKNEDCPQVLAKMAVLTQNEAEFYELFLKTGCQEKYGELVHLLPFIH